jgi:hypothetical protein
MTATVGFDPDRLGPSDRETYEKWCRLGGEPLIRGFYRDAAGFMARSRANGADDGEIVDHLLGAAQDESIEYEMRGGRPSDDPTTRDELLAIVRAVVGQVMADHPASRAGPRRLM